MPASPSAEPAEAAAAGLRVVQAMSGADVGGIETFFFDGVAALHEAGLAQHVVIRPDVPAHQIERLTAAGIAYSTAGYDKWWPWPTRAVFARVRREFRPNLAQFWTGRAGRFAVRAPGCRNVGWFGGYRQMKDFRACDDFIGITADLVRHQVAHGADQARTACIHTFSSLPKAGHAVPRASLDTPEGVPLLLMLARLHPFKGVDTMLKAMPEIPRAVLWLAGEGDRRAEYEALADALGVRARVRFLGWREDRAELLAAADLCAVPSRHESFGTVMAEAWGAGVPLVAAAAQGPRAYVEDGVNGMLVPVDDPPALAAAIRRVIDDPALRARLVQAGRKTFETSFTKDAYVRATLAFYRAVVARAEAR